MPTFPLSLLSILVLCLSAFNNFELATAFAFTRYQQRLVLGSNNKQQVSQCRFNHGLGAVVSIPKIDFTVTPVEKVAEQRRKLSLHIAAPMERHPMEIKMLNSISSSKVFRNVLMSFYPIFTTFLRLFLKPEKSPITDGRFNMLYIIDFLSCVNNFLSFLNHHK